MFLTKSLSKPIYVERRKKREKRPCFIPTSYSPEKKSEDNTSSFIRKEDLK